MRQGILGKVPKDLEVLTVDPKAGVVSFHIDLTVYPLQAVYGACYEYLDRAYVFLCRAPRHRNALCATLRGKDGARLDKDGLLAVAGEFGNKLLDHSLRLKVSSDNARLRELVVARALLSALPPSAETTAAPSVLPGDVHDDPFAIAGSWRDERTARRPG